MARIQTSRKSGFILRGGVMRRETLWFDGLEWIQGLTSPSTAVFLGSLSAGALAIRPFTVIRTRGTFFVSSDQAAATERYGCALGNCVISDQASAVGVTAIPTPITDDNSDLWFQYEYLMGQFVFGTAVGFTDGATGGVQVPIDSKAMRKVEEGSDLAVVVENSSLSTSGCRTQGYLRHLVKLH